MKQLTDEVFAQVRDALLPFAMDARGIHPDWSKERSRVSLTQDKPLTVGDFRKANEALAALDTAQPEPVEQPIEALQKLGARLAALLDEDQWVECEALLIQAGAHEMKTTTKFLIAAFTASAAAAFLWLYAIFDGIRIFS